MRWLDRFIVRLRSIFRRGRVEAELDRELGFHLAQQMAEHIDAGLSTDEARRSTSRTFGAVVRIKEECRESLGLRLIDELRQDVRYAVRTLVKHPGFTIVAAMTLSLGIGANTAIFSVVNAVLLRPLPYRDADGVITVWQTKSGTTEPGASPANFLDWRSRNQVFEDMAAAEPYSHNLSGAEPEIFRSWVVTAGFFQILGVDAFLGRTFTADEYKAGGEPAVVIGYGLWQRRFGADRNLIGQRLRLNGRSHVVVGVMPPEFGFPSSGREVWAARIGFPQDTLNRGAGYMPVVARLKPGTTLPQAQQDMDSIAARLAREYPQANAERGVSLAPLREHLVGDVRPALFVLSGAVGLVLLIACSNVANLLLVRASERGKESAVRAALGAGRGRLARQWLTESALLGLLGGVGGILLTYWALETIVALGSSRLPRFAAVAVDYDVLMFASAVSMLTALICGLAPALAAHAHVNDSLKERASTGDLARHHVRRLLVVSQIALALILLIGAGLLLRSFDRLLRVNPGFVSENVVALEVQVWGFSRTPDEQAAFFEQTVDRLAALPGVQAAGAVSGLPFHDNAVSPNTAFVIEGRPAPQPGQEPTAFLQAASADYFRTLGIPLRQGRFHNRFDRRGTPAVALINETLARRYWPDEDRVGQKITVRLFLGATTKVEIIGVVGDVRHRGLDTDPRPEFFLPLLQSPYGSMTYVVGTTGNPRALLTNIKQEIWAVNKNLPFSSIGTMDELLARSTEERRFSLLLLGTFATIALIMAGIGIYGMISFSAKQRNHEIGVRLALGASRRGILRMVVGEGMVLTLLGVMAGVAGAALLTRFIRTLLFEVRALDPLTFGFVPVVFVVIALIASYMPARRATKVDPLVALRCD
jgi:putative ABC transport system permease protein